VPADEEVKVPMEIADEKLPLASLSCKLKTLPGLKLPGSLLRV